MLLWLYFDCELICYAFSGKIRLPSRTLNFLVVEKLLMAHPYWRILIFDIQRSQPCVIICSMLVLIDALIHYRMLLSYDTVRSVHALVVRISLKSFVNIATLGWLIIVKPELRLEQALNPVFRVIVFPIHPSHYVSIAYFLGSLGDKRLLLKGLNHRASHIFRPFQKRILFAILLNMVFPHLNLR